MTVRAAGSTPCQSLSFMVTGAPMMAVAAAEPRLVSKGWGMSPRPRPSSASSTAPTSMDRGASWAGLGVSVRLPRKGHRDTMRADATRATLASTEPATAQAPMDSRSSLVL